MKIFSSLIAFVMMFACLSVAYADIAPYPRPQRQNNHNVTADIDKNGKLSVRIRFDYDCNYKIRLVDGKTGAEIFSGKGKCKSGKTVTKTANLRNKLSSNIDNFTLTIEMSETQAQTRFGKKSRRNALTLTKDLVVVKSSLNSYIVHVRDR